MKNKLMVFALLGVAFFMTACGGGSKLSCTATEAGGALKLTYNFEFNSDDKLSGVEFEEVIDFSKVENLEETLGCADIDECMAEAKLEITECESNSYYEGCKIVNETKTGLTVKAKVSDKSLETKDNGGMFNKDMTKEDVKKVAEEDSSFTCE